MGTTLDNWLDEITNYFLDRQTSGFQEGFNDKINVLKRRCYWITNISHLFQRIWARSRRFQVLRDLRSQDIVDVPAIPKESELSEMVGTTRPRISKFMRKFRILGLIETSEEHFLIIKEKKFTNYLAQILNSGYRTTWIDQ